MVKRFLNMGLNIKVKTAHNQNLFSLNFVKIAVNKIYKPPKS